MTDQICREAVDSGRYRGVRREYGSGSNRGQSGIEVQTTGGDKLPNPFDTEESGMPLVHVEHLGIGQSVRRGVGAHRADAADTREDLLLDAVILVPAVETVRDAAQIRVVLGDVGIEQQQRHSSDLSDPHSRTQHPATGHGDVNDDRRSVFGSRACVRQQTKRQPLRVVRRVVLGLPTVGGQRLAEVAGSVEQSDADERQPEVGRGLEVIARQDAQSTGVVGQNFADSELHGEVRNSAG